MWKKAVFGTVLLNEISSILGAINRAAHSDEPAFAHRLFVSAQTEQLIHRSLVIKTYSSVSGRVSMTFALTLNLFIRA